MNSVKHSIWIASEFSAWTSLRGSVKESSWRLICNPVGNSIGCWIWASIIKDILDEIC